MGQFLFQKMSINSTKCPTMGSLSLYPKKSKWNISWCYNYWLFKIAVGKSNFVLFAIWLVKTVFVLYTTFLNTMKCLTYSFWDIGITICIKTGLIMTHCPDNNTFVKRTLNVRYYEFFVRDLCLCWRWLTWPQLVCHYNLPPTLYDWHRPTRPAL